MLSNLPGLRIATIVTGALQGVERRVAPWMAKMAVDNRSSLPSADGASQAREHLRQACRCLGNEGLSHAEVFRELRLLVNKLEAGGLAKQDWPEARRAATSKPPAPPPRLLGLAGSVTNMWRRARAAAA